MAVSTARVFRRSVTRAGGRAEHRGEAGPFTEREVGGSVEQRASLVMHRVHLLVRPGLSLVAVLGLAVASAIGAGYFAVFGES